MGSGQDRAQALAPLLRERLRRLMGAAGWPRSMAVRRAVAIALLLLAAALAVRPSAAGDTARMPTLVAARDLAPGTVLGPADVTVRSLPPDAVPDRVLTTPAAATGRTLAGAARAGEPITDVRIVGPANTRLTSGNVDAATVGVRLADAGVADLLRPGMHVDVVSSGDTEYPNGSPQAGTLATNATVITVGAASKSADHGRLVLLALPRDIATRVAAASLNDPVTVTLR
ncbi:MAG: RcpC/CpaB family pilus assembly protein [Sciscionella sp.]